MFFIAALIFSTLSQAATSANPCRAGETKLAYSSAITVGQRVQLESPLFCANGKPYSILARHETYESVEFVQALCSLFRLGRTVDYLE